MPAHRKPRGSRGQPRSYEVGKGRPPVSTRWKPGQSGNPRGRPKGTKNLATYFAEGLKQKLEIQEKGKVRQITALEGIARRLINEALKGNIKAIEYLLAKEPEIAAKAAPPERIEPNISSEEAYKTYYRIMRSPAPKR